MAPGRGVALTREERELAEARVRAVRTAIGPNIDLHTDWAWSVTPADAAEMAERLDCYDLFWIEEPFKTDDPEEFAGLRHRIGPRLAGGEQLSTILPFRQLFEARALDVVMPDVKWIGGIEGSGRSRRSPLPTTSRSRLTICRVRLRRAGSVHLSAVLSNFLTLEYGYAGVPWRNELVRDTEVVLDGSIPLPMSPGLGIEWDGAAARRLSVGS